MAGMAKTPRTSARPGPDDTPTPAEWGFLLRLQRLALQYFVENQRPNGLMLDRQSNFGPRRAHGLCSTAATGMGLIALGLASAPPYRLLSPSVAAQRVRAGLRAALERIPSDHGAVPHFVDSASGAVIGHDYFSTVETAWLVAGALWSAHFLQDNGLEALAWQLYHRVDWRYWTAPDVRGSSGLLRHGKDRDGQFLPCAWDRLNGETAFMIVLGAGAAPGKDLPEDLWRRLLPFYGSAGGQHFNNADLGLFVFQYGLDLLDLRQWQAPSGPDLYAEARLATLGNQQHCRDAAGRYRTYQTMWGLSAGDGPGNPPATDTYRCYAPGEALDGTAHITATLASVAHAPRAVLDNLREARQADGLGRYGFSAVNLDRQWVGRDMVGIDAGAAVLALDNYLMDNRVRAVFHRLPCVVDGLQRLGFTALEGINLAVRRASQAG